MKVSLEWLSQYVDISDLSPEQISEALTHSGLEVEAVERTGPVFTNVVVAKVLQLEQHPNADRLRLAGVTFSEAGEQDAKVVCGAQNLKEGMLIAFAKEGAQVVNRKEGGVFTLGAAKIRGIESRGMICSLDELGLEEQYEKAEDGIWPLNGILDESHLGQDLKIALKLGGDVVLEVAPTANRGDLMSMLGIAREVAALFDRDVHLPQVRRFHTTAEKSDLVVALQDSSVCEYYGGALMRNVKIVPSPDWLSRRLQAAGIRPISNVVDVTNYVMLEQGQPLHAFDSDKLGHRGEVSVRRARESEKLTTLDSVERTLTSEAVLITMNDRPVALAGLMGGLETEIGDQTQTLFLEAAFFPAVTTRKGAKSVGLRTDASARFERGVDRENVRNAMFRAIELLQEVAGAEFVRLLESPPPEPKPQLVVLHHHRIAKILGLEIPKDTYLKILKKLGFLFQPTKEQDSVLVGIPSFRQNDVTREIDLIEEIIRIYGYDRIPYTLPEKTGSPQVSLRQGALRRMRGALAGLGLQEVVTTSLIGEQLLEKTGFLMNREQLVTVTNSHSSEHTMMRQSLLPNLLEISKYNQAQGVEDVWVYELGRTYFKLGKANLKNAGVLEKLYLSGLITGSVTQGEWHHPEKPDFYTVKGILEGLLGSLSLDTRLIFEPKADLPYLHPGRTASVKLEAGNRELGVLGQLHPQFQDSLKFRHPVYVFEINVETLMKHLKQQAKKEELVRISAYPSVRRDLALVAPETLSHQEILQALHGVDEPLLREVALFDEYRGKQLEAGHRSLAYRFTFRSDAETLTEPQVEAAMKKLQAVLASLPVQMRQ